MKNSILFSVMLLGLLSCKKNPERAESGAHTNTDLPIENLNIQTTSFSEIDSTGVLIFPLQMGQNKREDGSYSYKKMPDNGYWNIIFLNSNTNEYHLLTEKKVLILNYDYKYNAPDGINISKKTEHIFYNIRSEDYNNDKLLNEIDPIYLYVSDRFGKNLRQISPEGYSLNSWKYIQASNKIVMTATKDSNQNKLFDDNDETLTFEATLDQSEAPQEVFQPELKEKLKKLYDRDWKRIK
ncbi:hypothetical protein [Chryseobacterium pennipullorum]|uniref:Lipoprotein n=1 Tax=Chryseobacterium pennipullorum TaxID=2258963 RepID=A0A3D9ATG7_9FLAO|nr:hypothetical protein [Chryseobacterium pennipullorum]REC44634.1 hypothetical protein DRF67_17430 [Chryseobacterium pennipullorum]